MKKFWLAVHVLGWPFVISGAFYLSPWLGAPTLVVGGLLWLGSLAEIHDLVGKK